MPMLRPGELKILTALNDRGPMTYSELQKETGLQFNVLSDYLKRLQTLSGLIERDIETRKYRIRIISVESLFFNDVQEFLRSRMEKMLNEGKTNAGVLIADAFGSLILTENYELMKRLDQGTSGSNYRTSFDQISEFIMHSWDSYVLAKFGEDARKTIETYKRFLLGCVKKLSRMENDERKKRAKFKAALVEAKLRMESAFPRVQIPKRMVCIEAERWLKQFENAHDQILQPSDLDDLKNRVLVLMGAAGDLREKEDLAEKDLRELESMLAFLENHKHTQTYEKYLEETGKEPKTVVLITSFGFKGYMKKLNEWFPEEAERRSRKLRKRMLAQASKSGHSD